MRPKVAAEFEALLTGRLSVSARAESRLASPLDDEELDKLGEVRSHPFVTGELSCGNLWVDVQLLASARLTGIPLWTLDRRLKEVAGSLGLGPIS